MFVLVAPDKFKGSLGAREVAENIAAGLREILPEARIDIVPVADGGEGTTEVLYDALSGKWVPMRAHDPLGREITARYAYMDKRQLAVMEMSEAAGMRRLHPNERNVELANTFGVGEMLAHAARRGAREIIVGLGGSVTNDGGFGMARALGFQFSNGENNEIETIADLVLLAHIKPPKDLALPKIIAAADVRNPLLGERGATRVFGPQKGVTPEQIEMLERALTKLADVIGRDLGCNFRDEAGAGAAGGLGFGLMSFCGAIVRPGFDVVAETIDLESKIKRVDLVITGEGSLDRQTLEGKAPAGVARLAKKFGKRVFAIVGRANDDREGRELFDGVYVLMRRGMIEQESIARTPELLRGKARELAKDL